MLFPDIYLEVDTGWGRGVVAVIPSAGVVVILVVVIGFITAGQGEGDDAYEEDHADYINDVSGLAFHTTGLYIGLEKSCH